MSGLADTAREMGIDLLPGQIAQFDQYSAALREANQRFNLTRIVDPAAIETRHFLDSLTAALPLLPRLQAGERLGLVDVGAGAGLPGLALKIAFPTLRVWLVESVGKKAAFLRWVVAMLHVDDVAVLGMRAEAAARLPEHRDAHDWVTARALGPLPEVIEVCAPFLAPGGLLVAHRGANLDADLASATPAFRAMKMWARVPIAISLPGLEDGRGLVVGEKYGPTPERFPRRAGMAHKHPLA